MFYKSKYAIHDIIGDTTILRNFEHETLKSFYKDWYRPDLMAVIVVGDFNPAEIEKLIIDFSKIEPTKNERTREIFEVPEHKETLISVASDKELAFPSIQLMMKYKGQDKGTYKGYRTNIVHSLITTMINKNEERQKKTKSTFWIFCS